MAESRPVTRSDIDDIVALIVRSRGKLPADRKSLVLLDRLQPNSQWRHMLDAIEHDRLTGIGHKIAAKTVSAVERADYDAHFADAAKAVADHRAATTQE